MLVAGYNEPGDLGTAMGRRPKAEEEGNEGKVTDAAQDEIKKDCDQGFANKRKRHPSRKVATIHASPVDSKDILRTVKKKLRLVRDSIAFRVKRDKKVSANGKSRRYDDEDNKFFLTEMLKLVASGIDGHDCVRNVNIKKLYGPIRKRFGNHYSERQVYEKARRLRRMYMRLLSRSADEQAIFENSSKGEIFNLCHQLWGDCGVLKLQLEDEDDSVCPNEKLRFGLGDAASGREFDLHGLVPGRDKETDKGAHAEVDSSVPIVSSIHQDDSHGLKGSVLSKDLVIDEATPAEADGHVPSAKDMHVCLLKNLAEKPGDKGTEPATTQMLDKTIHDDNQGLLKSLERKCDLVIEVMQARLMTMVSNALEARDEACMRRLSEMLKPAGLVHDDKFVERMLTGSMLEGNPSIPKHLEDRWQRLRVEELKLVSDRLRLMLEVCQNEQAKLERQIRHSL